MKRISRWYFPNKKTYFLTLCVKDWTRAQSVHDRVKLTCLQIIIDLISDLCVCVCVWDHTLSKARDVDVHWSPLCCVSLNWCLPGKLVHWTFRVKSAIFVSDIRIIYVWSTWSIIDVIVTGCIVLFRHSLVRSNKNHDLFCYDTHFGIEVIFIYLVCDWFGPV
jgi:hypothetical protein